MIKYGALIVWSSYSLNVILGIVGRFTYKVNRSYIRTENVELVLVSVASRKVSNSLFETVKHTIVNTSDLPLMWSLKE
ncbi:hypothetical protein [Candidatus Nitrosocosmicus sp. R]